MVAEQSYREEQQQRQEEHMAARNEKDEDRNHQTDQKEAHTADSAPGGHAINRRDTAVKTFGRSKYG